ncbi:MAG: hypothetical protein R8K46_00975 [Mariprofundaceae bacterium]
MKCSCLCPPNCKRLLLGMLAVAVFIFIYEMIFHGIVLGETYKVTASLWRPEAEMQTHMPWLMAGQALMAVMFCYLYSFVRICGGICGGAGYGLMVGLLMSAPHLIMYAVQPVPGSLVAMWIAGGLLEAVLAGIIVAAIYPHEKSAPSG